MKKTLVLGASLNESRISNQVVRRLVAAGEPVEAVGARAGFIEGVPVVTHWEPKQGIHTVTLYLSPENQKEYYAKLLELNPKRVVFNPGTENPELYELLKRQGIPFEESCTLVLLATAQF